MKHLLLVLTILAWPGRNFSQTAIPFDTLLVMGNWKFEKVEAFLKKYGFTIGARHDGGGDPYGSKRLGGKQIVPPGEDGGKEIMRTFYFNEANTSVYHYVETQMFYTTSSVGEEEQIRRYLEENAFYEERRGVFNNGKIYFTLHHMREERNRKLIESLKFSIIIKRPLPMN